MDNKTQQRFMHKYATHDLDRQHKAKSIILAMDGKGVRLSKPLTFVIAPPRLFNTFYNIIFYQKPLDGLFTRLSGGLLAVLARHACQKSQPPFTR